MMEPTTGRATACLPRDGQGREASGLGQVVQEGVLPSWGTDGEEAGTES